MHCSRSIERLELNVQKLFEPYQSTTIFPPIYIISSFQRAVVIIFILENSQIQHKIMYRLQEVSGTLCHVTLFWTRLLPSFT